MNDFAPGDAALAALLLRAGAGERGRHAPTAAPEPALDAGLADLFGDDDPFGEASFLGGAPVATEEDPFAAVVPLGPCAPQSAGAVPAPLDGKTLDALERDDRLDHADADDAALLLAAMAASEPLPIREGGAVGRLLVAALRGDSDALAVAAALEAARRSASLLQVEVAKVLDRHAALDHATVGKLLDAIEALADGRVVRTMEATLAAHGGALDRHHAWRARHIIQSIRRGGRR